MLLIFTLQCLLKLSVKLKISQANLHHRTTVRRRGCASVLCYQRTFNRACCFTCHLKGRSPAGVWMYTETHFPEDRQERGFGRWKGLRRGSRWIAGPSILTPPHAITTWRHSKKPGRTPPSLLLQWRQQTHTGDTGEPEKLRKQQRKRRNKQRHGKQVMNIKSDRSLICLKKLREKDRVWLIVIFIVCRDR